MLLACRNRNIQSAISCPCRREAFRKPLFKGSLPEMDQDQERFISRVKATGGVPGVQNIQLPLCPSTRPERLGSGVGAGFG